MTCTEIETIIANYYGVRANMIVPNVSWGLGIHECDMLIVSKAGYCTEIEIKISKADLKKDQIKRHGHFSNKVKHLFFAVPEKLLPDIDLIPERAGIFVIRTTKQPGSEVPYHHVELFRGADTNNMARKLSDAERVQLGRLGCMRIWSLKSTIVGLRNTVRYLRNESRPRTK